MMTSPQVSWLFFKARATSISRSIRKERATRKKQPSNRGPEGCVENGPAAALLVGYRSIQICALLPPCRRPILNATTSPLYVRRYTRSALQNTVHARDNGLPCYSAFEKSRRANVA